MFRTTDEEVKELVKELHELKELLRGISSKIVQIEARAKRAFPASFSKTQLGPKSTPLKLTDPPTISSQEALKVYDELVLMARQGEKEEMQLRLKNMDLPNMLLLSRELGVPLGKNKPSRKILLNGVLGRINESVMLSNSSFRERPERSEKTDGQSNESESFNKLS